MTSHPVEKPLAARVGQAMWAMALAGLLVALGGWATGRGQLVAPGLVALFAGTALGFSRYPSLRGFSFTWWVLAFVALSLGQPRAFGVWFGVDLKILIVPLIQIIMFGMGTTLSLADFSRVLRLPWPVFVGIVLQFSIMPTVGYLLASALGFAPEIAAGIVLIGACPGGVASNLMAYLARGNVALSVTMTACSTLLSPVLTPLMMKLLAAQYIEIRFVDMMLSICNMILVPIAAGLLANRVLYSRRAIFQRGTVLVGMGLAAGAAAVGIGVAGAAWFGPLTTGLVLGFGLIAVVALAKWIVELVLKGPGTWMDRALPLVSMVGICYIIAIITARSADDLLHVGLLLLLAAITHNLIGYTLGYWLARLARLREQDCRTVAFEVGMQNGGMGSGLAMNALHSVQAALAPAIFGPWMNVSGSILATWWRGRPPRRDHRDDEPSAAGPSSLSTTRANVGRPTAPEN